MTVSVTNDVLIIPLAGRDITGLNVDTKSMFARWTSHGTVVGDASGGNQQYNARFGSLANPFVYGSHILVDIRLLSYWSTLSHAWITISIFLIDQSSPIIALAAQWNLNGGTSLSNDRMTVPDFKFRIGTGTSVITLLGDNVNTDSLTVALAGYCYHESLV